MKKNNKDWKGSRCESKEEYLSPTRFPQREFELIYRQKEHLPSSGAY